MTKKVMREVEIIDTDILKIGTLVHYGYRYSYTSDDDDDDDCDWNSYYDDGKGKVTDVDEDLVVIEYDGYYQGIRKGLTVEDLTSGFHKLVVLE